LEITLDWSRLRDHLIPMEGSERRKFERWKTSIPCTLEWEGSSTSGHITNLSFGGALIKQVDALPAQGTTVVISFEINAEEVQLNGTLAARILRTVQQLSEEGEGMAWLGLYFEEPEEEVRSKLTPVFQALYPEQTL
jgi:hypothetical protein